MNTNIVEEKKSNLLLHAEHELGLLCKGEPDEMQAAINKNILDIVKVFSEEGHSGFSASYTVSLLEKLLRFEPITPLTGADEEWHFLDYGDEPCWQNKRCSHVFKGADGIAYDINAVIFQEPSGHCYTSGDSRRFIKFPYVPKKEYKKVQARS